MRRIRILILAETLAAVCIFLVLQTYGKTGIGTRIEFQTITRSWHSNFGHGIGSPAQYIIQDNDTWASVWQRHIVQEGPYVSPSPLPEVDFSNRTVIAVFMGVRATTGYGTEIRGIVDTGLSIVVRVEETYPGPHSGVGDTVTCPCHIVETGKINRLVIFDTHSRPGK